MLGRGIEEKYYCGLDLGSQKIKASLLHVKDPQDVKLVGVYEHKTYGFVDASVSDLGELSECIHNTIQSLVKQTGIKVKEVQLGIGGELVDIRDTKTTIPLIDRGSKTIMYRDIRAVNKQARLLGLKMEEEAIHELPLAYQIDDQNMALNPLGLYARKLGVHSLMVFADAVRLRNLTKAVHQAGFDVAKIHLSSYAASFMVFDEKQKQEGSILIDMGARVTNVLIFKEGVLKFLHKIHSGGDNFTKAIAGQLNLPFDLAEDIKKSYATATPFDQQHQEEILIKRDSTYVPIKREDIYLAIEPKVGQLIEAIHNSLNDSGLFDQMNGGITLVGGASLLPGLIERIGQKVHTVVKLGKMHVPSSKSLGNAATFCGVTGLAQSGFSNHAGHAYSSNGHSDWAKYIVHRAKELYQEYF